MRRSAVLTLVLALGQLASTVIAQSSALEKGLHYFVVQNLDTGAIQRGTAGANGIAFDRLIMAPKSRYKITILQASTLRIGGVELVTPDNGANFPLPDFFVSLSKTPDSDFDELSDDAEFVMGTGVDNPDTDNDGILDGAEVRNGLNPLDGLLITTGIIGSADTPGTAVDICALNDIAIVADSDRGISVFNVFNGMKPTIIAQVDTPGFATAVACSGNRIAVADGTAGLAIVDITDPPAAKIVHQVSLGGSARAVAATAGVAYVGTSSGEVVSVDLTTGTELNRLMVDSAAVQDVFIAADTLYVLVIGRVYTISLQAGELRVAGMSNSPGSLGAGGRRLRLFGGDGLLYATHTQGYNTFNIATDPTHPALITAGTTPQFGWKQIIANGKGANAIGIAAVSPNSTDDGQHNVSLYDVSDPTQTNRFVTEYVTPGLAAAVSIYNGLVYVADSLSGMQVVNYLASDVAATPPSITLQTNFAPGVAEEGKLMRLTAAVSDDVQVRNVEFFVDGAKVATDGAFPFEHRFITPRITTQSSLTIRAKAFDTGGNNTATTESTIMLTPDATAPRVTDVAPPDGSDSAAIATLAAYFDEPMDLASLTAGFTLTSGGPDGMLDTPDDFIVTGGAMEFREDVFGAFRTFPTNLPEGRYRASVTAAATDAAGNPVANPRNWEFVVLASTTVSGQAVVTGVGPAAGAIITIRDLSAHLLGSALADAGGFFTVERVAVRPGENISVAALRVDDTGRYFGRLAAVAPVANGVTNVGVIAMEPVDAFGLAYVAGLSGSELSDTVDGVIAPLVPPDDAFVDTAGGAIFTGNFLQIGVNAQGTLIYSGVGLRYTSSGTGAGFGPDILAIGYWGDLWAAKFRSGTTDYHAIGGSNGSPNNGNVTIQSFKTYNDGGLFVARSVTTYGPLQVTHVTSMRREDAAVFIDVSFTNIGTDPIENMRFARSSDLDVNGGFSNAFDVFDTPLGNTIIGAWNNGAQFFGMATAAPFAVADSLTFAGTNPDGFSNRDGNGTIGDFSGTFVFNLPSLAVGETINLNEFPQPVPALGGPSGGIQGDVGEANTRVEVRGYSTVRIVTTDAFGHFTVSGIPIGERVSVTLLPGAANEKIGSVVVSGPNTRVRLESRHDLEAQPSPQETGLPR